MPILFHSTDIHFNLKNKKIFRNWISDELLDHSFTTGEINIIFCSDNYLFEMNKKYLNHNYYTDIITFNYNENLIVSGDLYISVDRVKENAVNFKTAFYSELSRVMIHGILHLIGYNDNSDLLKAEIHKKEDEAILRLVNNFHFNFKI